MRKGSILGYDLNEKNCQISYYDERKDEPETLKFAAGHYQIPLMLGYLKDRWVYGREAKYLEEQNPSLVIQDLFGKAMRREKVRVGARLRDAVWLLAKFISLTLTDYDDIQCITFSTPVTNVDVTKMLKGIGTYLGVDKENIYVQDYRESFCQYMFYQPKELWQYESALFFCDGQVIKAYMLRKLKAANGVNDEMFVTVDEVASAHIQELEAIYPFVNPDMEQVRDRKSVV